MFCGWGAVGKESQPFISCLTEEVKLFPKSATRMPVNELVTLWFWGVQASVCPPLTGLRPLPVGPGTAQMSVCLFFLFQINDMGQVPRWSRENVMNHELHQHK